MLAGNGFGLAEGGEFEIRMLKFTIMFNRISNVEACTFAPLLANPCCAFGYFILISVSLTFICTVVLIFSPIVDISGVS